MGFVFYKPVNNPTGLESTVGGAVDLAEPLSGYLNELFAHIAAPPSGLNTGLHQYRKVYVRNEYTTESKSTTVWMEGLEHSGQIHIDLESVADQTTDAPTGAEPTDVTGWVDPRNYIEGVGIGTLAVNASTGIWVRQTLSGIAVEDPYATFRLKVGGIIE